MLKVTVFGKMEITETDVTDRTLKYSKTQNFGCFEVEEHGFCYDDDWVKLKTGNKLIMYNKKDVLYIEIEES